MMCLPGTVIDIGGGRLELSLKELTEYQFLGFNGGNPRDLPTGLFYNTKGLKIWGDITRLPEYRQTQDEIDLLNLFKSQIADWVVDGCTIIDMGSGYVVIDDAPVNSADFSLSQGYSEGVASPSLS